VAATINGSEVACKSPVLVSEGIDGHIGWLVLTSSEAFENYPPASRAIPYQMLIVGKRKQPL
jgi:hypothetical protein